MHERETPEHDAAPEAGGDVADLRGGGGALRDEVGGGPAGNGDLGALVGEDEEGSDERGAVLQGDEEGAAGGCCRGGWLGSGIFGEVVASEEGDVGVCTAGFTITLEVPEGVAACNEADHAHAE